MLVELSPWQETTTSLPKNSKRTRKQRDDVDEGNNSDSATASSLEDYFPVVASFVASSSSSSSSRRAKQKQRHSCPELNDLSPLLTLTSSHNISVLGRSKQDHGSIEEFESLRYAGRPGSSGSFFSCSSSTNNKDSLQVNLPQIPAILDDKNDMVYAMQHNNTRLCCWHAFDSTGPNDNKNFSVHVELVSSALSMSLLPIQNGIVFGTCEDGRLFLARVVNGGGENGDGPTLSVEYLQSSRHNKSSSTKGPSRLQHIKTFADLPEGQKTERTTGRKRKVPDDGGRSAPVIFYQVMSNNDTGEVHFIRHALTHERLSYPISSTTNGKQNNLVIMNGSGHVEQATTVTLIPQQERKIKSLKRVEVLVSSSSGTAPSIAIVYTVSSGAVMNGTMKSSPVDKPSGNTIMCALFCLSLGKISHKPVPMPSIATQFGLVSNTIVAAASSKTICLLDLKHGGVLCDLDGMAELHASDEKWLLVTDAKSATLALLYSDADTGTVSTLSSTLRATHSYNDDHKQSHEDGIMKGTSLASSIASAVSNSVPPFIPSDSGGSSSLVSSLLDLRVGNSGGAACRDFVRKAVLELEQTCLQVVSNRPSNEEENKMLDVFEKSVKSVIGKSMARPNNHNPQEALPSNKRSLKNGRKGTRGEKIATKVQSPTRAKGFSAKIAMETTHAPELPQDFIDGSTRVIVSYLCSEALEAKSNLNACRNALQILHRLIETGKVSARLHFEAANILTEEGDQHQNPLDAILRIVEVCKEPQKRGCPCMDWILNILQQCKDVPERKLVSMLCYMVRYASPVNIAEKFARSKRRPLKRYCKKFISNQRKRQKLSDKNDEDLTEQQQSDTDINIKMSMKIILSGCTLVLHKILGYSECNEAMLRIALIEELGGSGGQEEAIILAKLLSNVLDNRLFRIPLDSTAVRSVCQWVTALCDVFHEELVLAEAPSGGNYFKHLIQSIGTVSNQSRTILDLLDDLSKADELQRLKDEKDEDDMDPNLLTMDVSGYSVAQLIF